MLRQPVVQPAAQPEAEACARQQRQRPGPDLRRTGLAAAGSLYGVLAAGLRVRDTLLPILMLPVVAPVLIAGTEAFGAAYANSSGDGWKWCGLLAAFSVLYLAIGIFAFEPLLEES